MQNQHPALQPFFHTASNCRCFQCGKPTKQWAQLNHSIILCLHCAALYKQLDWLTVVKSVGLDPWSPDEVEKMEKGGNASFYKFLTIYQLQDALPREKLTSKAAKYYRDLISGKEVGEQPSVQKGREPQKQDIPLHEMTPQQIFNSAKEKAKWLGYKTKELGQKGISKIQKKYEETEIKEGAKQVGRKISGGVQWMFGSIKEKFEGIGKK